MLKHRDDLQRIVNDIWEIFLRDLLRRKKLNPCSVIRIQKSGGRPERYRIQGLCGLWWFVMLCHLLVWVVVSPLCFIRSKVNAEDFRGLHAFISYYTLWRFLLQQDLASVYVLQLWPDGLLTMLLLCLIGQPTWLTWIPLRICWLTLRCWSSDFHKLQTKILKLKKAENI